MPIRRSIIVALGLLALHGLHAAAAPPPPAPPPPGLDRPILGYDLQTPFQLWRYWVERQKGPVVEALIAEPETLDGERAVGAPIVRFVRSNDFGRFLAGDVRLYCRRDGAHGFDRSACHYRLRRAFVPLDAASYGEDNPLARWTRESFDAERLARHLQAAGLPPDSDWWRVDEERIFSSMPSPAPLLREHARVVRVDSRDCPAFGEAVAALESKRVDWRLDFLGVGEDTALVAPNPHAQITEYSFRILVPGRLNAVTLQGVSSQLDDLFAPVAEALDACERQQPRPAGG